VTLLSLPVQVPALKVPLDGWPRPNHLAWQGPVLGLPAPENEYAEDVAEARWLLRALETGQPVTGGATGWVPPEIVELRARLKDCEQGQLAPAVILAEMKERGVVAAELTLRPDDQARLDFWRRALTEYGAERSDPWPDALYETYRLP
jgi:hypothetical protein